MKANHLELYKFNSWLNENIKTISLFELEKMFRNKTYPQVLGARKLLKQYIGIKLMLLDNRPV